MGLLDWFRKDICAVCNRQFRKSAMTGYGYVNGKNYSFCEGCANEHVRKLFSAKNNKERQKIVDEFFKSVVGKER